jgi:hypothetical protein
MLNYIFKKIINKITIYFWQKYKIDVGLYLKNKNNKKINKILLYFDDIDYMHIGDHLFFEPLIHKLDKYYHIEIKPIKQMSDYFKFNKIHTNSGDIENFDLIITKVEFLQFFKNFKGQILFIDTTNNKIKNHLCLSITNRVLKFLNIPNKDKNNKPNSYIKENKKLDLLLDDNHNYILFNNYIKSGKFRITPRQKNKLDIFATKMKNNTRYKIIHIGTKNDKRRDKNEYNFVDIDLRGETNLSDIFYLFSKPNVLCNISFDNFQMMVAFISKKQSYIVARKRLLKSNEKFIKNYVHRFFKNDTNLIEYI